jgi:predicted Zn-dependent protease
MGRPPAVSAVHARPGHSRDAQKELERLVDAEPITCSRTIFWARSTSIRACSTAPSNATRSRLLRAGVRPRLLRSRRRALSPRQHVRRRRAFRRCLVINPDYKAAHYRLALSLFHTGHLDEALEHFQKSMILTPEYLMAHYHMGVIYERRGELENAVREFQKSLDEGLGEVSSLHHLATIRAKNGRVETDRHLEHITE